MLKFNEKLIYTGHSERTSKQSGEIYTIVNFLGSDGQSFGVIAKTNIPNSIKQLDTVDVLLGVTTGRYVGLQLLEISK